MDQIMHSIIDLLKKNSQGLSVQEIAAAIDLNRNSTARYLDVLYHQGLVNERKIGPAKLYVATKQLPYTTQIDLFKKSMDAASCGITIADAKQEDFPLIYINEAFVKMTGYSQAEVIGKNCRFLQGDEKNSDARKKIHEALKNHKECTVSLKNFKKDGTPFKNELHLAPIFDEEGTLTHYIGIQTEK